MACCCASRATRCTPALLKRENHLRRLAKANRRLLAHHFTQAGMTEAAIEMAAHGQRSLGASRASRRRRAAQRALAKSRPADLRRRICVAKRSSLKSLSRTPWRSRARLSAGRTMAISRFTIPPNTVRLRRVLAGMSGWPSSSRSGCLWMLGYPAAARDDNERAVRNAGAHLGHDHHPRCRDS